MHRSNFRRAAAPSGLAALALIAGSGPAPAAGPYFERLATLPAYANLPQGTDPASAAVAEIVAATPDGTTLIYTDSAGERLGVVDIGDPASPRPAGSIELGGEPTSVTVVREVALAGVNTSESFTAPSGHVAVIDLRARRLLAACDVGGQPDSVAASPDGRLLAVAVENERDES